MWQAHVATLARLCRKRSEEVPFFPSSQTLQGQSHSHKCHRNISLTYAGAFIVGVDAPRCARRTLISRIVAGKDTKQSKLLGRVNAFLASMYVVCLFLYRNILSIGQFIKVEA